MNEPHVATLPHSIEAEQALLGAILINGSAFDVAEPFVSSADFFEPIHAEIFEALANARKAGKGTHPGLIAAAFGDRARTLDIAGMTLGQYLARLMAEATTIVNAPDFATVVRECAERRKIIETAKAMQAAAYSGASPDSIASMGIDDLDPIATADKGGRQVKFSIAEAGTLSVSRMTYAMQNPGQLTGTTTGLRDIDAKTNGLQASDLIILAGRPGMGKSAVAAGISRGAAAAGSCVLYYSLEMSATALSDRILSDMCFEDRAAHIPYWHISGGRLTNDEAERVVLASRELQNLPLMIDERAAPTVSQIAARARKHRDALKRTGQSLDLLVVDHINLVSASDRYRGSRVNEMTETSGALKALAKELGVPVLALAQLSREPERRDNRRPQLSDLRDSGAIEQDADLIMLLFREAYYLDGKLPDPQKENDRVARLNEVENQLELIIGKQRNGPTGTVPLFFNVACNAVRDLARAAQ